MSEKFSIFDYNLNGVTKHGFFCFLPLLISKDAGRNAGNPKGPAKQAAKQVANAIYAETGMGVAEARQILNVEENATREAIVKVLDLYSEMCAVDGIVISKWLCVVLIGIELRALV